METTRGDILARLRDLPVERRLPALKALDEDQKDVLRGVSSHELADALCLPQRNADRRVREVIGTPPKRAADFAKTLSEDLTGLQASVLELLQRNRDRRYTYAELSERFDRSTSSIRAAVVGLSESGYTVREQVESDAVVLPATPLRQHEPERINFRGPSCLFGVVSDTHLGSSYAATDMLESVYDLFASEGVATVLHCGDLTEGPGDRGYRGHSNDVRDDCQDWRGLENYVSRAYPQRDGITTYCISSSKSHDGWEWCASGRDPTADVCNGRAGIDPLPAREDMKYLGHDSADLELGEEGRVTVRLFHPDGGCAYADSYKVQKFIEAMPGGTKPDVFLVGHYHSNCYVDARNVWAYSVPGMQWQSPFFRRYGKEPRVGAMLMTVRLDDDGSLRSVTPENLKHYVRT
jgi:hypothetical protein